MLYNLFIVISSIALLAACQSGGVRDSSPPGVSPLTQRGAYTSSPATSQFPGPGQATGTSAEATPDLWQRIGSQLSWREPNNQQVAKAVDNYLAQPDYLPKVSQRGSLYLYYIVEEVQKRNMPMEIALIPLVESTLDPFAYSPGRAAGLWQIMPATGESLGLRQNWWFDGRRSIRDSTRVALDYLEQLHEQFDQDWLLALAAYNAGQGRVARARRKNLEKGLPTDFWSLELPRETRRYVPRVLALSQILARPESHNLDVPLIPNEPAFEIAEIGGQIELARAAELANLNPGTLRDLNPGHLRWATAPNGPQELLVPVGTGTRLERELSQLTPAERVRWRHYTIRRGDNLIGIARKFHTDVGLLRRANGISGSTIRAGATLMIPGSEWSPTVAMSSAPAEQSIAYRVKRGDSLYVIAGRYNISVLDIAAWNSLDPARYLQPGQTLKLHVGGSQAR